MLKSLAATYAQSAIMTKSPYPSDLTSYDILKTIAVIIMIIDHIGFYFYPQEEWLRAVGRVGFPIWFFLIGHAMGRGIPPRLLGGAMLLLAVNPMVGMALLPLNALFTIIFIRLMIDALAKRCFLNLEALLASGIVLAFMILPTAVVTEYGTAALITALFGYIMRHRPVIGKGGGVTGALPYGYAFFTWLIFVGSQQFLFGFSWPYMVMMAAGTALTILVLLHFRAAQFPDITAKLPRIAVALFHLGGRRTLEIYVIHLVLFKFMAAWLYPDVFMLFDLSAFRILN